MLIGPADIRFELWFDNQKLSRDQSITVDWMPAPEMPPPSPLDISTYNRVELPAIQPAYTSSGLGGNSGTNTPKMERMSTAIETKEEEEGRKKLSGTFLGRTKGKKWPIYGQTKVGI